MPRQNDVLRKLQKLDQRVHTGKAKTGKGRLVCHAKKLGSDPGSRKELMIF